MKEFLLSNWKELLSIVLALACLIVSLVRKTKVKVLDSAFDLVLSSLPEAINQVEGIGLSGEEKKEFVVRGALHYLASLMNKDFSYVEVLYSKRIDDAIEKILSTPQKKG